jgi:hypothetical protein
MKSPERAASLAPPSPVAVSALQSTQSDKTKLRYAWYAVFILMICYTLSFVDRQILSLLVAPMKRDLGLSDTRIGLLQASHLPCFTAWWDCRSAGSRTLTTAAT